jgi:transcriptional regulator GlxA family with amidase domain
MTHPLRIPAGWLIAALLASALSQTAWAEKPVVAVIALNHGTEVTDFLVPFGIIADSGLAEIHAVSLHPGAVMLHPSDVRVELPQTAGSFDALHPDGADYVIVPAVHEPDDPDLAAWLQTQRSRGATIMSICDGAWVLANAGLLHGREATAHWSSLEDLREKYPQTRWRNDRRYVFDDRIVTTSGVSASLPATLALLEQIAGPSPVANYARQLGVDAWTAEHDGASFRLSWRARRTAVGNRLAFWRHEQLGLKVPAAAEEAKLAFVIDAYSRTYRSSVDLHAEQARVRSKHGLIFHAAQSANLPLDATVLQDPLGRVLNSVLTQIEQRYGNATADFVALQLEYPRAPLD